MSRAVKIKDVFPLLLLGAFGATVWLVARPIHTLAANWLGSHGLSSNVYDSWWEALKVSALNPLCYVAIILVFVGEWLYPAKPKQKLFSVGFGQDVIWVVLDPLIQITVVAALIGVLSEIYHRRLEFLTIDSIKLLPAAVRFAIAILVGDFFGWFNHWVRHRVQWLWKFHVLHHSQRELNIFTDVRAHLMDYLVGNAIKIFPFIMFVENPGTIVLFGLFHTWYTRLYHSNIRTNYGFLRYFMVTPQSHRVHHSIDPRHRDQNFGSLFSVWDRIFHTQYSEEDEYPDTGVEDNDFPLETTGSIWELVSMPFRQQWYPFKKIILD